MACSDYSTLQEPLQDFTGQGAMEAVICAYTADVGLGAGLAVMSLLFFGVAGLGLTIRNQHPGPIVVAGMLSVGVVTVSLPAGATQVLALALFFAIAVLGLYLYQRAQSSL